MKITVCALFLLGFIYTGLAQENPTDSTNKQEETLIIYGSSTCHYCQDTKAYLKEHKVPFEFCDIYEDRNNLQEMVAKLKQDGLDPHSARLPVVDMSGKIFMNGDDFDGFLENLVEKAKK